jgi:hypothetical protein
MKSPKAIQEVERLALEARSAQINRRRVDWEPIRVALADGCRELGVDARRPGVPSSGSFVDEVARRLELPEWRKAKLAYEARLRATNAAHAALAEAQEELRALELRYVHARSGALDAGTTPPVPTDEQADEASRLLGRLHLLNVGLGHAGIALSDRTGDWSDIARSAIAADEWPAVLLVMGAMISRVAQKVAESPSYDAKLNGINRGAQQEWNTLRAYTVQGAGCRDAPKRASECEAITWAWSWIWPAYRSPERNAVEEIRREAEAELEAIERERESVG